jgi:hypothetical protein
MFTTFSRNQYCGAKQMNTLKVILLAALVSSFWSERATGNAPEQDQRSAVREVIRLMEKDLSGLQTAEIIGDAKIRLESEEVLDEVLIQMQGQKGDGAPTTLFRQLQSTNKLTRLIQVVKEESDSLLKARLMGAFIGCTESEVLLAEIDLLNDRRPAHKATPLTRGRPLRICDMAYTLAMGILENKMGREKLLEATKVRFARMYTDVQTAIRDADIARLKTYWQTNREDILKAFESGRRE